MDQMDEFEMRPLTTGLGFQKKMADMKQSMRRSQIATDRISLNLPVAPPPNEMAEVPRPRRTDDIISEIREALKPLDTSVKLSTTLPRHGDKKKISAMETEINRTPDRSDRDPLANINFQVPARDMIDTPPTTGMRRGASDSLIRPLVPISFNFASAAIDGVIVLALSMIFLATLVSVTGIEVNSVLMTATVDAAAQIALGVLVVAVMQLYLVLARSFFGRTIGEWTFDVQLGEDAQIEQPSYPIRVVVRSFLNMATGLVVLPIVSAVFGRDLAGQLTGIKLFRQNS